jgi:hypothetical protein
MLTIIQLLTLPLSLEVSKGMYGLPQAGRVASDALIPRLALAGYKPTGRTPGLFKHITNSIKFCLVVDDFLVGSCNPTHTEHLKATLQEHYTITEDAAASRFCGMTLDWDYQANQGPPCPPQVDPNQLWRPNPICRPRGYIPTIRHSGHHKAPENHWNPPVLCLGS